MPPKRAKKSPSKKLEVEKKQVRVQTPSTGKKSKVQMDSNNDKDDDDDNTKELEISKDSQRSTSSSGSNSSSSTSSSESSDGSDSKASTAGGNTEQADDGDDNAIDRLNSEDQENMENEEEEVKDQEIEQEEEQEDVTDQEMDGAEVEEEQEDVADQEMDGDQEEQEEVADQELDVAESEVGNESPGFISPNAKKDMHLRSGKRKRRRSVETSGLTPPDQLGKASKKSRAAKDDELESKVNQQPDDAVTSNLEQEKPPEFRGEIISGRASLSGMDAGAVAGAQIPESSNFTESMTSPIDDNDDPNRRLFDSLPPPMPKFSMASAIEASRGETDTAATATTAHAAPTIAEPNVVLGTDFATEQQEGTADELNRLVSAPRGSLLLRICFVLLLSISFTEVWPMCVSMADWLIPVQEFDLPDVNETVLSQEDSAVVVGPDGTTENLSAPHSLLQTIESLTRLQSRAAQKHEKVASSLQSLDQSIDQIAALLQQKKEALERSVQLNQVREQLREALQQEDLNANIWQEVRNSAEKVGKTVLNLSELELWQVELPETCSNLAAHGGHFTSLGSVEEDENAPISANELEDAFAELMTNTKQSAADLMESPEAAETIRQWVRKQIQSSLQQNRDAANAIADLAAAARKSHSQLESVEGLSNQDVADIVQERLERERADRTGEYDHAAVYNGARIIRGGNQGTSKSLVDSLPLANRLLHIAQLQFYGYGPEAAITPTYPPDALGQCWSFQQTPVEELLKRRRSLSSSFKDGHKRGNFGTLTVSLPTPVLVHSVVIEHPPKGLTDQTGSAIRAFRVIGYEDAEATSKGFSLGTFEYDINAKNPLQEYGVATEASGVPVPPLRSITLAIDSNWGHDYACLYRFRVHGEGVDEDDLEEIDDTDEDDDGDEFEEEEEEYDG